MRILMLAIVLLTSLSANSAERLEKNRLQLVMSNLLVDIQMLAEGIFREDYQLIANSAEKVANHPNPGPEILSKVKKNLGAEMPNFKAYDIKVHNAAAAIVKLAEDKDMNSILAQYHAMVDGCQGCHGQFKQRISKALNEH